jgi:hypothetical protein
MKRNTKLRGIFMKKLRKRIVRRGSILGGMKSRRLKNFADHIEGDQLEGGENLRKSDVKNMG